MTINSKNLGGHGPFGSPGYAYGGSPPVTSLCKAFSRGITICESKFFKLCLVRTVF